MSTLTSTASYPPAATNVAARISEKAPAKSPNPGRLARLFGRLVESRRQQAMIELQRHGLRLPRELEEAGWKISERNEDSLPFVR
jgi:hypothetical protein